MKKFTLLSLLVAALFAVASTASAQDDGFVSIFNGKDLTGWAGNPNLWSVEDGCIVGQTNDTDKKITVNQALYYTEDKEIGDFAIKFDYKISNWGNSGLYYRGWFLEEPEKFRVGGYQGDFDGSATYSGIMYGESAFWRISARSAASIPRAKLKKSLVSPRPKKFARTSKSKTGTTTRSSRKGLCSFIRSTAK